MIGPIKLAITGTHSTGKSTFLDAIDARLKSSNLKIGRIGSLAKRAREVGFPILTEQTVDGTLWIMAEGLRLEAELSLSCDVVLVDRPPLDAVAYLIVALELSGRTADEARLERLRKLVQISCADYEMIVMSVLNPVAPLGAGREAKADFREPASRHIAALCREFAPNFVPLEFGKQAEVLSLVENKILQHKSRT